jgi:hypothetical protein
MRWSDVPAFAAIGAFAVAAYLLVVGDWVWFLYLLAGLALLAWSAVWAWRDSRWLLRRAQERRGYFWGSRD